MITLKKPPMGWNSWDCYGAAVNEIQVRANAEYMAKNLKEFGWEYIVVDIQWFEPNAISHEYNKNAELVMDEFGRLLPATNRFLSAQGNNGFKPLADYVHSLGLKFGIHILRGIPKQAVRMNTKIKGSNYRAAEIADFGSVCSWNGDMCGVDTSRGGAQEYYNSIFELYADWGVDFVKVDDIARPYHKTEVEAISNAIKNSGRDMVLSLSPGAAPVSEAEHLSKWANMWRMTDDFWDDWELLKKMFDYCREWFPYVGENHFPDCDMLPLGRVRLCNIKNGESTKLTQDEQKLLMSLWAIFRSPLMFGGDMTMNDEFTLSLMQNREIIEINQNSCGGREVYRKGNEIVWTANGADNTVYLAHFNIGEEEINAEFDTAFIGFCEKMNAYEIWTGERQNDVLKIKSVIPPHGVRLYKLSKPVYITGARGGGIKEYSVIADKEKKELFIPVEAGLKEIKPVLKLNNDTAYYSLSSGTWENGTVSITDADGRREEWKVISEEWGNPVLDGYYADPNIVCFGDTYYIYPTTDGGSGWNSTYFKVFSSKDLINWKDEGKILSLSDVSWSSGVYCWAPAAIEKDGKYYFYYSGEDKNSSIKHLGVAVSDSPAGPFTDKGEPLVKGGILEGQMIDPAVFIDDDGQSYIYWGNCQMYAAKLGSDMMSIEGEIKQITPPNFIEATFVIKRKGIYYFMWSNNDTGEASYEVHYGTSASPMGPINGDTVILSRNKTDDPRIKATGHHSVLNIPNTDEWYICYHRFNIPLFGDVESKNVAAGNHREVCIDKMEFDANGNIIPVTATLKGIIKSAENTR